MKKLLVASVAAVALMGTMASEADAFGIVIRFGGFRIHHASRHHINRHHRSEAAKSKPSREAAKAEPKFKDIIKNKEGVYAVTVSGDPATAGLVLTRYSSAPTTLKSMIGPVIFYIYANVADFRRDRQLYNASDSLYGYSVQWRDPAKTCVVNLIESAGEVQFGNIALIHELAHCIDFRYNVGHRMSVMEAYFADVAATGKDKMRQDGFAYYLTEPQEAYASAMAYLLGIPTNRSPAFETDFPRLMAELRRMLDVDHIAYNSRDENMQVADDNKPPTSASAQAAPVPVAPLDY